MVDTPGVRSFGLHHIDPSRVINAFPDLQPGTEECPRGCTHDSQQPECALDAWVAAGHADPARLDRCAYCCPPGSGARATDAVRRRRRESAGPGTDAKATGRGPT